MVLRSSGDLSRNIITGWRRWACRSITTYFRLGKSSCLPARTKGCHSSDETKDTNPGLSWKILVLARSEWQSIYFIFEKTLLQRPIRSKKNKSILKSIIFTYQWMVRGKYPRLMTTSDQKASHLCLISTFSACVNPVPFALRRELYLCFNNFRSSRRWAKCSTT